MRYHSKDNAGNVQDVQIRFVQLDTTPPYSSNTIPDSYVNDATPTISLDILDDGSGVDDESITMTVEDFQVTPTITPISGGFHVEYTPSTPFSDGIEVYVSIDADDIVGNSMSTVTWSFTVDLTPPTTTLTTDPVTPDGEDGWFVTTPTITLDCDDSGGSGCSATYYKWDDGSYTEYTAPFSVLEGIHTLYYYSVDVATNNEDEQSREFKVDTHAPSFASVVSDEDYYKDGDTVTVTADLGETDLEVLGDFSDFESYKDALVKSADFLMIGIDTSGTWAGGWHKKSYEDDSSLYDTEWEFKTAGGIPYTIGFSDDSVLATSNAIINLLKAYDATDDTTKKAGYLSAAQTAGDLLIDVFIRTDGHFEMTPVEAYMPTEYCCEWKTKIVKNFGTAWVMLYEKTSDVKYKNAAIAFGDYFLTEAGRDTDSESDYYGAIYTSQDRRDDVGYQNYDHYIGSYSTGVIKSWIDIYGITSDSTYLDAAMLAAQAFIKYQFGSDYATKATVQGWYTNVAATPPDDTDWAQMEGAFMQNRFDDGISQPETNPVTRAVVSYTYYTSHLVKDLAVLHDALVIAGRTSDATEIENSLIAFGDWIINSNVQDGSGYFNNYYDVTGDVWSVSNAEVRTTAPTTRALLAVYEVTGNNEYKIAATNALGWLVNTPEAYNPITGKVSRYSKYIDISYISYSQVPFALTMAESINALTIPATHIGGGIYEILYTIQNSVEGQRTINVIAIDVAGNSKTDSSLSVTVDNTDPVADANGDYTDDEGSSITFDGTGSFDNYEIASYEWDLDDDGEYDDATGVIPQFTWNDDYSGDIGLKVTDLAGNTDTDSTTVTVNNVEPVVEAGTDQATDEGTIIYLDPATFTDDGILDTHTAEIDWGDGTTEAGVVSEAGGSGSVSGSHTYADNGVYTVTVTVTDDDSDSASDTLTVTVSNVAPVVNAGPDQEVDEGEEVSFSGSFTDQGTGDTHTIEWDFGDGGSASGTLTPTHIYEDQGIYTVTLTVTDDDGGITSDTLTVTVNDVSPTANAGPDQEVNEGDTVSFDGSGSEEGNPSDTISLYTWDFGDGSIESGDSLTAPTHVYADDGTYTVTLTVDDEDSSDSDTMTVTVNNVPPTVAVNSPNGGEVWNDVREITWTATDLGLDDIITIDIYYSADGGDWNLISSGEENDGIYSWDTETVSDGKNYLIKVIATDDEGGTSDDISDGVFTIDNSPPEITASSFYVEVGDPITILPTTITDDNNIVSATLYYSIGGVGQTPMSDTDGEPWEWNIDPQSSHTTITYRIEAEDEAGNEGTSTTYTVTVYDFVLHLYDGWNQISVPKQPDAASVTRILGSGGVFQYDAEADPSDPWIYGEYLTSIKPGIGYFIESEGEQWIGINYQDDGSVPPSVTDVGLEPGWNLVGYMCTQPGEADEVIPSQLLEEISVVYWYDTGISSYDLIYAAGYAEEEMEPGKGYWVHIPKFYGGEKLYYINICM